MLIDRCCCWADRSLLLFGWWIAATVGLMDRCCCWADGSLLLLDWWIAAAIGLMDRCCCWADGSRLQLSMFDWWITARDLLDHCYNRQWRSFAKLFSQYCAQLVHNNWAHMIISRNTICTAKGYMSAWESTATHISLPSLLHYILVIVWMPYSYLAFNVFFSSGISYQMF